MQRTIQRTMAARAGDSNAVPCFGPHPRKNRKSTENLHSYWNSERGHITYALARSPSLLAGFPQEAVIHVINGTKVDVPTRNLAT